MTIFEKTLIRILLLALIWTVDNYTRVNKTPWYNAMISIITKDYEDEIKHAKN